MRLLEFLFSNVLKENDEIWHVRVGATVEETFRIVFNYISLQLAPRTLAVNPVGNRTRTEVKRGSLI